MARAIFLIIEKFMCGIFSYNMLRYHTVKCESKASGNL